MEKKDFKPEKNPYGPSPWPPLLVHVVYEWPLMHYAIKALFCMANLGRFVSSTNQDNAQYNLDVVGTFWNFLSFSGQQLGIERSDDSNMVHRRPLIIALTLWSMANLANSGQASIGSRFETSKFASFLKIYLYWHECVYNSSV